VFCVRAVVLLSVAVRWIERFVRGIAAYMPYFRFGRDIRGGSTGLKPSLTPAGFGVSSAR